MFFLIIFQIIKHLFTLADKLDALTVRKSQTKHISRSRIEANETLFLLQANYVPCL